MASIGKEPGGKKKILFITQDGKRPSIRLGKCSMSDAQVVRTHIEELLNAKLSNRPVARQTAEWLGGVPEPLRMKLARYELCELSQRQVIPTVGQWLETYFARRSDWKPNTRRNAMQAREVAEVFFDREKQLDAITPGDAEDFRRHLQVQGLSEATIRRRCKRVKQFFAAAVKKRILTENVFDVIPTANVSNSTRFCFVEPESIEKVIKACPDAEWRLIFALARYGGLRCPSEVLRLRWEDVNWEISSIMIHASKTEHHADTGVRVCPLFAELQPYLADAFNRVEPGAEYCIERYRNTRSNLRTQAHRIIKRAGLKPWPKIFQNLRSSRETELCDLYPVKDVTAWLGNSPDVARKHYLQPREVHFRRAVESGAKSGTESGTVVAHFPAQQGPAPSRTVSHADRPGRVSGNKTGGFARQCEKKRPGAKHTGPRKAPLRGLEPRSPG